MWPAPGCDVVSITHVLDNDGKIWAAFEDVSTIELHPMGRLSVVVDARNTLLPFQRPLFDDYDPRDHRTPKSEIRFEDYIVCVPRPWMAYFDLLRAGFGPGLLGLPLAVSLCGIVLGPLMVFATGLLMIHQHLTLLWCLNEISRQLKVPYISYRYGFRLALLHGPPVLHSIGHNDPCIIALFMIASQLGICSVFVIFCTDSLRDILDWESSKNAILIMVIPYMILEICMKTLRIVSYIALFSHFLNFVGLLLMFYFIFAFPHGDIHASKLTALPLVFSFGTMLFAMSGVGVVLSVDKALKDPKIMTKPFGVIWIGMFIPTIVSVLFGALGYWSFGSMEDNALRSIPYDKPEALVCFAIYMITVTFLYPLQSYPGIAIFVSLVKNHDPKVIFPNKTLTRLEFVTRPFFVIITFFISYFVPLQAPLVAFVGNLCTSMLCLVFPALMEICILYPSDFGKYNFLLIKDIIVITIGLLSWVFGVILIGYVIYLRLLQLNKPESEYL